MSSIVGALWTHLKSKLNSITGGPTYTINLTAADRVQLGTPPLAGALGLDPPAAYIDVVQATTRPGPALTQRQHTAQFDIFVFVSAAALTSESLTVAAWDAASDVERVIYSDRSPTISGAVVTEVMAESTAMDGGHLGYNGIGLALVRVTINWRGNL